MEKTLKDRYDDLTPHNFVTATQSEQIAFAILDDVTDRGGWRQEWDGFDDDIQSEILETWVEKIESIIDGSYKF